MVHHPRRVLQCARAYADAPAKIIPPAPEERSRPGCEEALHVLDLRTQAPYLDGNPAVVAISDWRSAHTRHRADAPGK